MAEALRDVSHTTIMRWEDDPSAVIPSWVVERLFADMPVTLPLSDLHTLLDMARENKQPFEAVLSAAIREYIAHAAEPENITPLYQVEEQSARVADEPPG